MEAAPTTRRLIVPRSIWLGAAALAALAAVLLAIRPAHAAVHHAALVIQHSSGRVLSRCLAFAEEQITGLQLIERSGIELQTQSFGSIGSAICQLDQEPSAVPAGCFGSGAYWQYSRRSGAGWRASDLGASRSPVRDGDMDGWRYASGTGQVPPALGFATVCAPLAPALTHTAAPAAPSLPSSHPASSAPAPPSPSLPTAGAQALAPSAAPTAPVTLASTGPPPRTPLDLRVLILGIGLTSLAGLAVWNLVLRR